MDGSKRTADPSLYALCPLIPNIDFGTEEEKDRTEISCVAALGKNIYLGCTNGKLMGYTLEESIDGSSKYTLTSQRTLKTPILSLQLAPTLSKALVLSDDTLSLLSLPRLDPVPSDLVRSMKNVLGFAINETPMPMEPVGLAIVKRTGISFWEVGNKFHFVRDIPTPGVMHVRRTGPSLCIADPEYYSIIDLQSQSHLPLHAISQSPTWKILPTIEVSKHDEYLMVACTATSSDFTQIFTMGLFVNGRGEPTRSPMEWGDAPEAVCVDGERVVSLHSPNPHATTHGMDSSSSPPPSTRVEIRKAGDSDLLQSIPLPSSKISGDVKFLTLAREGFVVPVNARMEKLWLVPVQLSTPPPVPPPPVSPPPPSSIQETVHERTSDGKKDKGRKSDGAGAGAAGLDEPAGSGLTPPPTPKKPSRPSSSHAHGHTRSQSRNANGQANVEGPAATGASRMTGTSRMTGASGASREARAAASHFPTSRILLATKNSVMALVPSTILSQVEEMLEDGKVRDAASFLAGLQGRHAKDEDLAADFRYLNLRIGIAYLFQTAFEDAGDALFRGELDPRWLMGLWDEWAAVVRSSANGSSKYKSGSVGGGDDNDVSVMVDVYAGLLADLEKIKNTTIKQIVSRSLVANYSPHLKPSTAESAVGQELQKTLEWSAREMLAKYLRKFRTRRQFVGGQMGGMYTDEMVNRAVDTVSVMLYVQSTDPEELQELRSLLDESPFIALDDVREPLVENGHIASLARIYEKKNDQPALIDLYVKVADGVWKDESISDPVGKVKKLLQGSKDRGMVQKYALWLLKRDRSSGLKLLISNESKRPISSAEDANLLTQIRDVDARAGIKFLEYLVLQKKTPDPSLHTQLVTSYLDSLVRYLDDPKVAETQRSAMDGYLGGASRSSLPFLFYLVFETPNSDHKRVRLKLVLMLQGSNFYDLEGVRRKLRVQQSTLRNLLCLETAILDAKAGDHKAALSVLVNDLQDFISAEAYCSLGGRVITPKIAAAIGDRLSLADWAALVLAPDTPGGGSIHGNVGRIRRQGSSGSLGVIGTRGGPSPDSRGSPEPRKAVELTRMLLEVYMKAGESRATEASRLLNAQAVNLDALDIIPQMPATWSLDLVSSFLSRSFRRSLHEIYEGQILKQLSAGQNLQTSELAFEAFSAAGAMIEESNGEAEDRSEGEDNLEKADSGGEDTPGGAELKELGSRIEEKLAEKRRLDHADTRPDEIRVGKPRQ